jgi:hypothetical protein
VAAGWSDEEVARRWLIIAKIKRNGSLDVALPTDDQIKAELAKDEGRVSKLRQRLSHVSWFMGALCEHISRRINVEEGITGTCWEGRYDLKLLADEPSILVCGIYVDLNVVRAGLAATPEESRHTSVFDRIRAHQQSKGSDPRAAVPADGWLCKLTLDESRPVDAPEHYCSASSRRASDKGILSVSLPQYLELLDCTGRRFVEGKRGKISDGLLPILRRLRIDADKWFDAVENFEKWFGRVVGAMPEVTRVAERAGRQWFRGQSRCAEVFAG